MKRRSVLGGIGGALALSVAGGFAKVREVAAVVKTFPAGDLNVRKPIIFDSNNPQLGPVAKADQSTMPPGTEILVCLVKNGDTLTDTCQTHTTVDNPDVSYHSLPPGTCRPASNWRSEVTQGGVTHRSDGVSFANC